LDLKEVVRAILIELHPTERQKDLLYRMFRSSAEIYNTLIDFLQYKRKACQYKRKACQELQKQGIEEPWKSDPDLDICRKGWATELIRALIPQKACEYPKREVEIRIKSGRQKGEYRLEPATIKHSKPDYGVSGQTQGLICQAFEASIKACVSKWKKGDYSAELPRRKKGLHCLYFSSQEIKRDGNKLKLGSGKYRLVFKLDELAGIDIKGDARIYRTRGGKIMLSLTRKIPVEPNPELTKVAAIDFGQKRAMVIATADGATAAISGKDICALKRERDRRYREINRLRSRMLRGQIRQYLTAEEKEKMRSLQLHDNKRQRQGKKRTGVDIKYALRIIRQRRKEERQREIEEQGLENVLKRFLGRELSENDKQKKAVRFATSYDLITVTRRFTGLVPGRGLRRSMSRLGRYRSRVMTRQRQHFILYVTAAAAFHAGAVTAGWVAWQLPESPQVESPPPAQPMELV